jgi:hypothetical protein
MGKTVALLTPRVGLLSRRTSLVFAQMLCPHTSTLMLLPSTQRLVTWIIQLPQVHARLPHYMPAPLSGSATGTTITNAP